MFRCFDYAASKGSCRCAPQDETSLEKLNGWGMEGFKVASADFTNHALISQLAATGKPLICSTGMASELEIRSGIRHLQQEGANYVLLHCNSPIPLRSRTSTCAIWNVCGNWRMHRSATPAMNGGSRCRLRR